MPDGATEQDLPVDSLTTDVVSQPAESTPTQPVDTGEQTTPASETTHSTPPVETDTTPKVDPRPRDEFGRFKPQEGDEVIDSVQEAINRLAKPEPGAAAKEKAPVGKPGPTAKQPEAKAPTAKPATPDALTTDPLVDLTPSDAEKAHWSTKTKERFEKLLSKTKELYAQRETDPDFTAGKDFNSLKKEFGLDNDIGFVPKEHIAGLIQVQAAINRSLIARNQGRAPSPEDVQALGDMGQTLDQLRAQFGLQSAQSQTAVKPFAGALPDDLKDLVEVYGIDEKRVRMLAALEAGDKPPAQQQQQQIPAQQVAPVQQQQPLPQGVDMQQLYSRRFLTELTTKGDENPQQTMRVLLAHPSTKTEVMRKFPGTTPADVPFVFNALDAKERYEVLTAAHTAMTKQTKVPVRSITPPPPTTNRTLTGTATPRKAAPDANGDPVAAAIAFMARE